MTNENTPLNRGMRNEGRVSSFKFSVFSKKVEDEDEDEDE